MNSQNVLNKVPNDKDFLNYFDLSGVNVNDFISIIKTSNGQTILSLNLNPLVDNKESIITLKDKIKVPNYALVDFSMSQRVRGDFAFLDMVAGDTVPDPVEIAIASISQTTTTLTVVLNVAFPGDVGDWFDIYGVTDNRLNYFNACVNAISLDKKTLTITTADDAALPSQTISSLTNQGFIKKRVMFGMTEALGVRYSGTSATTAAFLTKNNGINKNGGTFAGIQTQTTGSTASVYTSGANGYVDIKATSKFKVDFNYNDIVFSDFGIDTVVVETVREKRNSVKPDFTKLYTTRFRGVSPKNLPVPVAKILSIAKTGTTTATVTLDRTCVAAGIVNGLYAQIGGVRDTTNFPNLTAGAIISGVSGSTFNIVIGGAVTASSYGGFVTLTNGTYTQPGLIAQVIQTVARDLNGYITLVGNTTWAGLNVGDIVYLNGCINGSNIDTGLDGFYKVNNFATTTLILEPVFDYQDNLKSPVNSGIITTVNAGGSVLRVTSLRFSNLQIVQYEQNMVNIDGQGSGRIDKAVPVHITNTMTANTTETTLVTPTVSVVTTTASTNATSIKTTAGTLYCLNVTNKTAATIYVKLYNKASAPTVGTDVPVMTIPVAAGAFYSMDTGRIGHRLSTGIALAVTGAAADADTTVTAAGAVVNIDYI